MIWSSTHRQPEVVLVFLVKFSCEVFCGGFRELALLVQNVNNSCLFCFNKGCNLKKPLTYVLKKYNIYSRLLVIYQKWTLEQKYTFLLDSIKLNSSFGIQRLFAGFVWVRLSVCPYIRVRFSSERCRLACFILFRSSFRREKNPTGDILSSNAPSPFELSGVEPRAAFQKDLSFVWFWCTGIERFQQQFQQPIIARKPPS